MAAFPTLASGYVAKYPLTRRHTFRSEVYTHVDGSEQRFSRGFAAEAFDLTFSKISTADKETIRSFFNSSKGSLDTTWTLTLPDPESGGPTTWNGLQFVPGQAFEATETSHGLWNIALQVRQTRKPT